MPPKIRTSKEMIVEAGYTIADMRGIEQVNCRAIAAELGCSTQPVFSRFPNMDELKEEVFIYACNQLEQSIFEQYEAGDGDSIIEISVAALTGLAKEHRNLFNLIYLSDHRTEKAFVDEREKYQTNKNIIQELMTKYRLDYDRAKIIFERISLLTHGICTVIATTTMEYTIDQVIRIVKEMIEDSIISYRRPDSE